MKTMKRTRAMAAILFLSAAAFAAPARAGDRPADADNASAADRATAETPPASWPKTIDDTMLFHGILVEKLEIQDPGGRNALKWDAQAWLGTDLDKLWLKTEGTRKGGRFDDVRTEVLYSRAIASYWDTQAGIRTDAADGLKSRNWAAFGVQGLAPYFFETEATGYISDSGHLAARLAATYDLLLTQRLVLTPSLTANLYSKDDRDREIGSGLSDLEGGLRLRYEVVREFAPYIGVNWLRKIGRTEDIARSNGQSSTETSFVAGVRLSF